ncbi:MAG: class I SAM-dependent methyltransferase [Alphaproteobacteria bacterium]
MAREAPSGRTSNFSAIASCYDTTRDMPEGCLLACYDRLIARTLFPPRGRILDAGCGTGQVSLPLAARGYEVCGIDISREMIELAQSKVGSGWSAEYAVGDVRDIAHDDASFDAVVVSKLFQHVEDWKRSCCELIRVVRPGSPIIQINERGVFGNSVRRYFSSRADELGFTHRYVGLNPHSSAELSAFMTRQGCTAVPVDMSDLRWELTVTYGEAIDRFQQRLFAEFWYLPADTYARLVAETAAWIESQPSGRDTVEKLEPYLAVEVFRTAV